MTEHNVGKELKKLAAEIEGWIVFFHYFVMIILWVIMVINAINSEILIAIVLFFVGLLIAAMGKPVAHFISLKLSCQGELADQMNQVFLAIRDLQNMQYRYRADDVENMDALLKEAYHTNTLLSKCLPQLQDAMKGSESETGENSL